MGLHMGYFTMTKHAAFQLSLQICYMLKTV